MSRSALWRQEGNIKDRQRKADETFAAAIEEGRENSHLRGAIPLSCPDDTFNIHPMLLQNISKSPYFQKCCEKLTDWNTLVDEIYYEVKHMEPWTAGTCYCRVHTVNKILCGELYIPSFVNYLMACFISLPFYLQVRLFERFV